MGRLIVTVVAFASVLHAAQKPAETAKAPSAVATPKAEVGPREVVQQLFDAMAARDALAAKELFMPEAGLFSVGANGKAAKLPLLDFLNAIGSGKVVWRERMWNEDVQVHGVIAMVWGPYDFHNNGAFSHCGYDSFSLLKTAAGWKISYISDTRETEGCSNPLGPPTGK